LREIYKQDKFYNNDFHGADNVLSKLWQRMRNEEQVVQEATQIIAIGTEALLTNLLLLLHFAIKNPHCIQKIREELDGLKSKVYGHDIWRDPRVLQLEYLVSFYIFHPYAEKMTF